jgi:hypothetical protein
MGLERAWRLCASSRSLRFLIPASFLLLAFASWNVWHYRLERSQLAQAKQAERASKAAAASASEEALRAESTRRANDARSGDRIQELYDEINQLTHLSERVLLPNEAARGTPAAKNSQNAPVRTR